MGPGAGSVSTKVAQTISLDNRHSACRTTLAECAHRGSYQESSFGDLSSSLFMEVRRAPEARSIVVVVPLAGRRATAALQPRFRTSSGRRSHEIYDYQTERSHSFRQSEKRFRLHTTSAALRQLLQCPATRLRYAWRPSGSLLLSNTSSGPAESVTPGKNTRRVFFKREMSLKREADRVHNSGIIR